MAVVAVAQLIERRLAKAKVAGLSPVSRSKFALKATGSQGPCSSVVERTLGKGEVVGSAPITGSMLTGECLWS